MIQDLYADQQMSKPIQISYKLFTNVQVNQNSPMFSFLHGDTTLKKAAIGSIIGVASIYAISYLIKKKNSHYNKSEYVQKKVSNIKSIDVKNGGKIYWNEYGDIENGFPILCFHGGLSCNLESISNDKLCKKYNLRLIAIDRPECGKSKLPSNCNNHITNLPLYYPMSSYMDDIKILLSHLNIMDNEYGVIGTSHGGGFAMSCIYYLKPKFIALYVAVVLAPKKYLETHKSIIGQEYIDRHIDSNSFLYRFQFYIVRIIMLYFKSLGIAAIKKAAEGEQVDDIDFELLWYNTFKSVENGIKGVCYTAQLLYNNQWGFDLNKDIDQEIKNKLKIFTFNGKNDSIIKYQFATHYYNEYLINQCKFKNVDFNMYDDVGHFLNPQIRDQTYQKIKHFVDEN